jgi:hypothetical protein
MESVMPQRELPLIAELQQPSAVETSVVQCCKTYREAVRMSWALRRIRSDSFSNFAANYGLIAQHVSDYVNADDKPGRRDLPGDCVNVWNCGVGNTLVTQWIAARDQLTVLEEMQATRKAA